MNHNRRAAVAEDRAFVRAKGHVWRDGAGVSRAVRGNDQRKVRDIASGRTHGHAIMPMARAAKMRTSRFKVGRLALGHLMNVNGVLPWWEILDVDVDFDALGCGRQSCGANVLALHVLEVHYDGLCGLRVTVLHKNHTRCRQKQRGTNGNSHGGSSPRGIGFTILAHLEKLWIQYIAKSPDKVQIFIKETHAEWQLHA